MVEVYNFENLIKIQVQMFFGSDSAKLLLKDFFFLYFKDFIKHKT